MTGNAEGVLEIKKEVSGEVVNQLSFFLRNIPTPIKAGMSKLIIKSRIEALKPTEALSPIWLRK
jgi:hypothetical protein